MAGLRPSALPRSGLVQRCNGQISQDLLDGEYNSILESPRCHLITLSARASTPGGIVDPLRCR
jgi:hypothetical protein